ncbi:class I SAM-dependent methyltransferase [Desulfogranum marinum]|uniref:class I SAM-dependent methyltransferase n=1 Tax=Desulfogranum marinum TaxID=453220 RepID=UPI0019639F5C|nr:class I SAM-dependent methyltransferase [Desulfogranum marinum]MBM9513028.1 class I SAM-dependent methyltransferase [Desulfogranum marinum]
MLWNNIKRILPYSLRAKVQNLLRKGVIKILPTEYMVDNALLVQQYCSLESKLLSLQKKIDCSQCMEIFDQRVQRTDNEIQKKYVQLDLIQSEINEVKDTLEFLNNQYQEYRTLIDRTILGSGGIFSDKEYDLYESEILKGRLKKEDDYYDTLIQECKEGARVLDIGCGKGRFIKKVTMSNRVGLGIDMNKRYAGQDNFELGMVPEVLYHHSPGSFDYIFSFHVIEHLSSSELRRTIEECYRILHKGGKIYLETPNIQSLVTLSRYYFSDPTHMLPRHPAVYNELLKNIGFRNVEMRYLVDFDEKKEYQLDLEKFDNSSRGLASDINSHLQHMYDLLYSGSGNILFEGEK